MKTNDLCALLVLWIVVSILGSACATIQQPAKDLQKPGIDLEDCQLSAPGISSRQRAWCGDLMVYENRAAGNGRQIELHIAVIPAVSRNPAPDPLFFIPGGPGEAATQAFLAISSAFDRIKQKRDIILVDQRGTGASHPLHCQSELDESSEPSDEEARQVLQRCLDQLDADPRFYTTSIAMDDLDQVRQALGYEQINIYGASYGTRAALVYLHQYPERVRTVILDGVAPPNWTLGPSASADGQRALEMLLERCVAQPDCQATFPDLWQEIHSSLKELEEESVKIFLDHPVSGEPITYEMTRQRFANTIHSMSYAPETAALIPLFVHSAHTASDYTRLAALSLSNASLLKESISTGMRLSVVCAEDVPFYKAEAMTDGYLEDTVIEGLESACEIWPGGQIPPDFKEPVVSDVPVLILSGEADPVTPPANGEMAARTLSNSLHIITPGMGHINIFRGCIPSLAADFVESGSIRGTDISCVQQIGPMPFFINFNGPPP